VNTRFGDLAFEHGFPSEETPQSVQ
jgi:hypothetical protein